MTSGYSQHQTPISNVDFFHSIMLLMRKILLFDQYSDNIILNSQKQMLCWLVTKVKQAHFHERLSPWLRGCVGFWTIAVCQKVTVSYFVQWLSLPCGPKTKTLPPLCPPFHTDEAWKLLLQRISGDPTGRWSKERSDLFIFYLLWVETRWRVPLWPRRCCHRLHTHGIDLL